MSECDKLFRRGQTLTTFYFYFTKQDYQTGAYVNLNQFIQALLMSVM